MNEKLKEEKIKQYAQKLVQEKSNSKKKCIPSTSKSSSDSEEEWVESGSSLDNVSSARESGEENISQFIPSSRKN